MPNPNAIVSRHVRLETPPERDAAEYLSAERGLSILLDDGRRVRLDPDNPRSPGLATVLEGLSKLGRPVYLEVDPETSAVTRLLIPHVAHVVAFEPSEAGYDVEIDSSHARHILRRDQPDFAELEAQLRDAFERRAPVILTEDDAHNVIDLRFFEPGPDDGPSLLTQGPLPRRPPSGLGALLTSIWYWPLWPWWWFWPRGCISLAQAQQVFDAMSATSCNPLTVPPPCIPFLYPDDGCWGRAHEMCRLMIAMGLSPKKVWIEHSSGHWLHVSTRNNPNCFVEWGWHVAPTLCVRQGCIWWFWTEQMVIDPSLFTTPVTQATWKSVQGDPGATLTPSAAAIFYLWGSITDPTYAQTNQVLATYRLQLQNRSILSGPPPYANCP
jgi:Glutaminase